MPVADRLGCFKSYDKEKGRVEEFQQFDESENVALGDGRAVKALGSGNVHMNMLSLGSKSKRAVLYNVLYVPKLACNLFYVQAAVGKGNVVEFGRNHCRITDATGIAG